MNSPVRIAASPSRVRRGRTRGKPVAPFVESKRTGLAFIIILALWVVTLFDPQVLLAAHGLTPALKIPKLLLLATIILVIIGVPTTASWKQRWTWHLPLLAFIIYGALHVPFVINNGLTRDWLKEWWLSWVVIVGTIAVVDNARRVELLMVLFGTSFLWYGMWGSFHGHVSWHTPLFFNPDAFGALMAIGFGFSAYMITTQEKGWIRRTMTVTAALCLIGVVSSFARGAFLAMVAVFIVLWLRSDHKFKTLAVGLAGALLVVWAASFFFGHRFWTEIGSSYTEGTTQGTNGDRWVLWNAAWKVFLQKPIFGVGPRNWGVFASGFFSPGELGSRYANPARLYNRSLHNLYMQTLSEMGVVGSAVFLWIIVDFWKRNIRLRTRRAQERWHMLGGKLNLRAMAFALELAMVAFLALAIVYDMSGKNWFFTIQGLNLLLYYWVFRGQSGAGRHRGDREPRKARAVRPLRRRTGTPRSLAVRANRN